MVRHTVHTNPEWKQSFSHRRNLKMVAFYLYMDRKHFENGKFWNLTIIMNVISLTGFSSNTNCPKGPAQQYCCIFKFLRWTEKFHAFSERELCHNNLHYHLSHDVVTWDVDRDVWPLTTSLLQVMRLTDYMAPVIWWKSTVIVQFDPTIVPANSCFLSGPLLDCFPVFGLFDCGHPCFRNFTSTIPVDVSFIKIINGAILSVHLITWRRLAVTSRNTYISSDYIMMQTIIHFVFASTTMNNNLFLQS